MDCCGDFLDLEDFGCEGSVEFCFARPLRFDFDEPLAGLLVSGGICSFPASNLSKSSSDKIATPRERALSCFEPGSEPTTTKLVSLLTELDTLPPWRITSTPASSRERRARAPVNTNDFPAKRVSSGAWRFSVIFKSSSLR